MLFGLMLLFFSAALRPQRPYGLLVARGSQPTSTSTLIQLLGSESSDTVRTISGEGVPADVHLDFH